jgi:hypothetical protein
MFRRVLLFSLFVLACVGVGAAQVAAAPDASRQELSKLIAAPMPAEAVAQAPPAFYGPDNLYKYMDGGADIFVIYGVRTLLHVDARAKEVDLTIDIFDMGSPDTAFGMYAAERSPDYKFGAIGAESYADQGTLNFFQDRYYVKLAGFGEGADAVLEAVARQLSARIGANPAPPALLAQLPAQARKPHSEQYMPNDPLGHPFLGPAYVVAYTEGEQESKLFVTVARDEADARQRLKLLEQHLTKTGQCKPAPERGEGAIQGSNSFEGIIFAQTKGRNLLLLLNPGSGGEKLIKEASESLK